MFNPVFLDNVLANVEYQLSKQLPTLNITSDSILFDLQPPEGLQYPEKDDDFGTEAPDGQRIREINRTDMYIRKKYFSRDFHP